MHTRNITLKEYCRLSGYSYHSKGVNRHLQAGNLTVGMVDAKKFGNSWMITVLESWYQVKSKDVVMDICEDIVNKAREVGND